MYFRYKVNWNFDDDKPRDDTGLVYADNEIDDTGFTDAMEKICKYFDSINKVELEAFAPDDCLDVSAEALDAIQENVIW